MAYVQFIEQCLKFLLTASAVKVIAIFEDCENIVFNAELAENRRFLRQVTQAQPGTFVHRFGRQVPPIEQNIAAVRRDQTNDHVKGGGLAGTIGAEQADDFATFYFERQAFDDLARLVAFGNFLDAQNTHSFSTSCSRSSSASISSSVGV